jgi:putative flippase GtrA
MIFSRFLIVGFLGTITNLSIFFIFVDLLKYQATLISIFAFFISNLQNYILNHHWTFFEKTKFFEKTMIAYMKYFIALSSLILNLIVLNIVLNFFDLSFKVFAQAFGIAAGTVINFVGSKNWVFK